MNFQFFFISDFSLKQLLNHIELRQSAHFQFEPRIEYHEQFFGVLPVSKQGALKAFVLVGYDHVFIAFDLVLQEYMK